jgi:hypothetical protein
MNSLLPYVKLVRQSRPTTCGQACVAMLSGVSERAVCEGIGKWGATYAAELAVALRHHGANRVRVPRKHPTRINRVEGFIPCGIVRVTPVRGERVGHWVLWVGDAYLCPTHGEMEPEEALAFWASHGAEPELILPVEVLT